MCQCDVPQVGALCVGLFTIDEPFHNANTLTRGQSGLFKGGGLRLLGVQMLAVSNCRLTACLTYAICLTYKKVITVVSWAGLSTWILLAAIDKVIPIRMCIEEEILGIFFLFSITKMAEVPGHVRFNLT